jgi:hypothetical protein
VAFKDRRVETAFLGGYTCTQSGDTATDDDYFFHVCSSIQVAILNWMIENLG